MTGTLIEPATDQLPRLLGGPRDLPEHRARFERPLVRGPQLIRAAHDAGLLGRGGAGFPTARKLAAVATAPSRQPRAAVANGTEGEPLSQKDKTLLTLSPHLVLDGLCLAAEAVGADRRVVCIERGNPSVEGAVRSALRERPDDSIELFLAPRRYVSGQESALVDLLEGGAGRPTLRRPSQRGLHGRPTLVDNVETLAHLALIAHRGPAWYRQVGPPADPGSTLLTVSGAVARPGVYEVARGHPVADLLERAGAEAPRAVLVGGYFGTWLPGRTALDLRLDRSGLAAAGASLGCGVVAVVDESSCAVEEVARVAAWYAAASAGQCGACTWGLRDVAAAARSVGDNEADPSAPADIRRWAAMIRGRGACRLPDGAAAFFESALDVFAEEVDEHRAARCRRRHTGLLPTPPQEPR